MIHTYFQQNNRAKEVMDVCSVHSDHWLLINLQTLTELTIHKNPDGITFQTKTEGLRIQFDKPWRQNDRTAHQTVFRD